MFSLVGRCQGLCGSRVGKVDTDAEAIALLMLFLRQAKREAGWGLGACPEQGGL